MKSEKTWVENVSDISYNAEDLFDNEVSYLEYSYIYKKTRWETEISSSLSLLFFRQAQSSSIKVN